MRLFEMKCKNCGARLKVNPNDKEFKCDFCNTSFKLNDGIQHHKIDDAEQTGYEFEKGRIRAKLEAESMKKNRKEELPFEEPSEERKPIVNILFFALSMACLFIMPSVFYTIMRMFFEDSLTLQFLSELFAIVLLFLIYYKDLIKEFKIYIKNFKKNFPIMLKYYVLGIIIMIMSNLLINMIIGNVSANESSVRDSLFAFPVYTMLSIMIVAPLSEELVFRKSISPLIKNKWIYAIVCGLLFGGAHLLAGKFKLINLLYLIPYGSLGFVFALMNRETKTTFSSITMHCIHNTATGILLLVTYSMGVL